jgi:SAM-dependent methyltransferase
VGDPAPGEALEQSRIEANRRNWDDRVPIHVASEFYDVEGWLARRAGPRQRETAVLGDVRGLALVHLQCHFGIDTLNWADAGATVTGLDLSGAAVAAARELAGRAGLSSVATFVEGNVFDAVELLGAGAFDVVYVSLGALNWLPDVGRWANQVAGLLRPGGRCYLHEGHPLAWALEDDSMTIGHPYFQEDEPYAEDSAATYTDGDRPVVSGRHYEWNHGIGEVVTALLERGLRLDALVEHDWTVHQQFPWLVELEPEHSVGGHSERRWAIPPGRPRIPLTYTLLATKR